MNVVPPVMLLDAVHGPLTRHPDLVFYLEHCDHIHVWRVPHGQRDVPAWMRALDAPRSRVAPRPAEILSAPRAENARLIALLDSPAISRTKATSS
jgi:hypothetical protein